MSCWDGMKRKAVPAREPDLSGTKVLNLNFRVPDDTTENDLIHLIAQAAGQDLSYSNYDDGEWEDRTLNMLTLLDVQRQANALTE